MTDDVRVVFRKYDGSLHWHGTLRRLGEDEHGVWLLGPVGTLWRRAAEEPVRYDFAHVCLIPRDAWWVASFNAEPKDVEVYVDISTTSTWLNEGEVTMVDLDLDVVRMRSDGQVRLLDEDEFSDHQRRYGYPPEVVASARATADWLVTAVAAREPFVDSYRRWLVP